MRSRLHLCSTISQAILAFVGLFACTVATSQAAVQNRITNGIRANSRVALVHTVSPKAALATDLGAAPSSLKLEGMTMHFNMTDTQQAALTKLLADQQNPASPLYRQWLMPQQFGEQFGLSVADLATVSAWLTAQGFTVTGTANSSTFITFNGTVSQVQQAFSTSIHRLSLNGEEHIANLTEPTLPAAIAGVVADISGLNDFRLKPRIRKAEHRTTSSDPKLTIAVCTTSACAATEIEHFITPGDFATIYDSAPLLTGSSPINGNGVSIAIMGQVNIVPSDIAAFRTASGLSANVPTVVTGGTNPGPAQANCPTNSTTFCPTFDDLDESELDIEWAGGTAPSASIIFVQSTDVIGSSLVYAIDNKVAQILSVSYGGCEVQDFPIATMTSLNTTFQQANAQGQTIIGPSGDTGATDCENNGGTVATTGLAVDFPGSSPSVTTLGGTEFSEGTDAGSTGVYWNNSTATNAPVSSALSYIPETVWNDTASEIASDPTDATFSSGGGGVSVVFPKPSWQIGTGVPNDSYRDVPDLAFSASADHDAYMVCAQGSCQNGTYFTTSTGSFNAFGGTSVSTPSFAGVLALVEQKLGGTSLGNINQSIYELANGSSYASIFHDVTTGDNKQLCKVGSTGCTISPIGYSAGVGYDQASGWGSLDVNQFVTKFSSVLSEITTTTTLTASNSAPVAGSQVTFTATITPASTGSAAPTGSVAFSVDGGTTTTVTLSAGVAAFPITFNTAGTHTITAVYSGDTNYFGSTTSITETVTAGSVVTTTTLTSSSASVALGSSITFTAAVSTSVAGTIAGTVTFTSGSVTLGTANLVANTNGNTAVATLTITASATNLPVGTDSVTAAYAGSTTYGPSTSNALTITVTNPMVALAGANISIANGSSGSTTITLTSSGSYAGSVVMSASSTSTVLNQNASISFVPATVTLAANGTATTVFTLATSSTAVAEERIRLHHGGMSLLVTGGGLSFASLLLLFGLGGTRRKRWSGVLFALLATTILGAAMGCGGSSSTVTASGIPNGTYTITVTGTDSVNSTVTGSTTVTVTLH